MDHFFSIAKRFIYLCMHVYMNHDIPIFCLAITKSYRVNMVEIWLTGWRIGIEWNGLLVSSTTWNFSNNYSKIWSEKPTYNAIPCKTNFVVQINGQFPFLIDHCNIVPLVHLQLSSFHQLTRSASKTQEHRISKYSSPSTWSLTKSSKQTKYAPSLSWLFAFQWYRYRVCLQLL